MKTVKNEIKAGRARRLAHAGQYPDIFDALPRFLLDRLTGEELAAVIDLSRDQHIRGEGVGWRDAVETYDVKIGEEG